MDLTELKRLHDKAHELHKKISRDTNVKEKQKEFMLLIVRKNFNILKDFYQKVKVYEKQLSQYEQVGKKDEIEKTD